MKRLETEWDQFRRAAIPKDAPGMQLTEMRRGFFAGAWAIYTLIMAQMTGDREPTPDDFKLMEDLHTEMVEFNERVKKGWA